MAVRRLVLVVVSVLVLAVAVVVASTSVGAVEKPPKPKPAVPKGPGPFHPFASFASSPNDNVVLKWNDQALAAIRTLAPPPPVTARALAIMNTSIYNAWTAYDATAVPTQRAGWARRPAAEHAIEYKSMAISYAAHRALTNLFPSLDTPERGRLFTSFLTSLGYTTAPTGQPDDPATIGIQAADAVIAARANDGANQAGGYADTTGYAPTSPPGPLTWQPLPGQSFAVPHWQQVTPFALSSASQFLPPGPGLKKSDGSYDKAVKDIIGLSAKLDDQTKARAEYWADGPRSEQPPGHWHLFAGAISRKHSQTIDQDTKLNFAVSNALLDAGITAWNAKRRYDFIRPVTAVRTTQGRQDHQGVGRTGPGDQAHPGRAVPLLHPHPAVSRLCVRAQHLQRRRRPSHPVLHRQRHPEPDRELRRRQLVRGTRHRPRRRGPDGLVDSHGGRGRGRAVARGRRDPLPRRRRPRPQPRTCRRHQHLEQGPNLLPRHRRRLNSRRPGAPKRLSGRTGGPEQGLADQALLGVAGKAMLMPVQATVQAVLGGRLAFGNDIAAVDADRGRANKSGPFGRGLVADPVIGRGQVWARALSAT